MKKNTLMYATALVIFLCLVLIGVSAFLINQQKVDERKTVGNDGGQASSTPQTNQSNLEVVVSAMKSGSSATKEDTVIEYKSKTEKIFVTTLFPVVSEKNNDKKVVVTLTYLVDNSKVGPIFSTVKTEGSVQYAKFTFTMPPNGWPVGGYKLSVSPEFGSSKDVVFNVL